MVDRRVGVHVRSHQNVAEECLERSRSLGCDTQHLAPRRIGKAPAGADQDPEQVAGCARIAERTVRALVGDAEAAAEEREAVALVGREQDAGEVERVVDEARSEVLGEQRAQEQQVERAAVGDKRCVTAKLVELQRALAGRRRADDVVVGEADEALYRQRNRHLRIDDHLELADRTECSVVAHGADLEDSITPRREPGRLEIEGDQVIRVREAPDHAAGELPPWVRSSALTGRRSLGSSAITRSIMIAAASLLESARPFFPSGGRWNGSPMRNSTSAGRGIHAPRGITRSDPQLATGTTSAPEWRAMKPAPAWISPRLLPSHERVPSG